MKNLNGKKILIIICGGIAAYKSLEIIRLLKKNGSQVKCILTKNAKNFITPLSVVSLSQEKVYSDLFNSDNESEMDHISLSRWADLILIAPATANTISKISFGLTDDLASTVVLASNKKIFIAPAMNVRMWEHQSNKENLKKIKEYGYEIANSLNENGFETTLISGPTNINYSNEIKVKKIISGKQMFNEIKKTLPTDIAVCTAAVSDFKPVMKNKQKLKKKINLDKIQLEQNPDILEFLGKNNRHKPKLLVGFSAETENIIKNSIEKMHEKHCDIIIANDVSNKETGFNVDFNEVTIIENLSLIHI